MMTWYSCVSNMGFQLRSVFSAHSSSLVYIAPRSCSFTLMMSFVRGHLGIGERLQYCNKDSGIVMRYTFSPFQENCVLRKMKYHLIFTARGGTCLLVHLPPGCSYIVLVNNQTNSSSITRTWIFTSTSLSSSAKILLFPFYIMKAALHTGERNLQ